MEYRRLGKTELQVSVIGFGGIPVQRINNEEAIKVINKALDMGINFFDTGRGYTNSEEKLGLVLKERRQEALIATKSMERTKEGMKKDVDISLKNLAIDYIDLYQLHNVKKQDELDQVLAPGGALEALIEAKQEGLIKHIGITGHIKSVLLKALKTGLFETVQFPFNPVETDGADELLRLTEQEGIGVIAMKPLAGGALASSNAGASLKFILSQHIHTVIPGMDSVEQVASNASVGHNSFALTAAEQNELHEEVLRLGNIFCRRCEYCQPCPEGVNIPAILLFEGYHERYNLKEWAVERYNKLSVKADACEQCGICEEKCPYDLPIREMLTRAGNKLAR